jgi:nicotinate-nucleotide adenylyltransferase
MKRIGIYAGSFDPIHDGHVSFALAAIDKAKLDEVYFLPERTHRVKRGVTHLAHRLAMLKLATESNPGLKVMELPDKQFSVAKTLPRLNQKFPGDQLYLIIGSDVLEHMGEWPLINRLLARMGLVVGLRIGFSRPRANRILAAMPVNSEQVFVIKSPAAEISSATIRQTFMKGETPIGLDIGVKDYIVVNWLYVSPSNSSSAS